MKRFFAASIALFALLINASSQEEVSVVTHNKDLVTTSKANNKKWGKFPSKDEAIRKIIMKVTMGTPIEDGFRCADWDYSDPIYISKMGGTKGKEVKLEIGRMLTPYGGSYPKGWQFQWEADVTDFASMLRDSVEINYTHNGYEPGHDRGWAVTVEFVITKGKPILNPIKITEVYNGSFPYGKANDDIENYLKPYKLKVSPNTGLVRSRILQTGHGMDKPENCAEFCSKWREMIWNGKTVERVQLWKNCGDNPLYPQAGTWIYDRANWCPGDLIPAEVRTFKVGKGSTNTYDLAMQPYASQGAANQQISAYLIEFEESKVNRDVEVYDIVAPTNKEIWARYNPTVTNPIIIVKNNSPKKVKSLEIDYGVEGGITNTDKWKGEIEPFGKAQITLSKPINNGAKAGTFKAIVKKVNSGTDEYVYDNSKTSNFNSIPKHKDNLTIVFEPNKTSNKENSYYIEDKNGNKIFQKLQSDISDVNKTYTDILNLEDGEYQFRFFDSKGDGLEFWANKKSGNGRVYLLNEDGEVVKFFNPDFGDDINYAFTVENSIDCEVLETRPIFWLTETNTTGKFRINLLPVAPEKKITVKIVSYDSVVESQFEIFPPKDRIIDMDISSEKYASGRHFVIVEQDGNSYLRRVFKTKQ